MFIPKNACAMTSQADNTPRITSAGIMGLYFLAMEQYKALQWIPQIAMTIPSNQEVEEYAWLGSTPEMREWIGAKIAKSLRENGMTIRNKKFESTMKILGDWIRRDKTTQIQIKVAEHARAAVDHDAVNLSTFISNATGSTNGLAYDGQYFFDNDHTEGDSGTQKNLLTASEVTQLDVATATTPTPMEVVKAILGVIGYMMQLKDDNGQKRVNMGARKFLVMTSPALMPYFLPAFTGLKIEATGAVDNPLPMASKVMGDGFEVTLAINPLLTYTTQFTVWRTDGVVKPLIIQEEKEPNYAVLGEDSDHYFKEDELLYSVTRICNWGYGAWQYAAHATMS